MQLEPKAQPNGVLDGVLDVVLPARGLLNGEQLAGRVWIEHVLLE